MRILLDGWPLIHTPGSPAALHLDALLRTLPEAIQAILALPGEDEALEDLPDAVERIYQKTQATHWGLLSWQQTTLPRLANHTRASLLLTASAGASLYGRVATIASPAGWSLVGLDPSSGWREKRAFSTRLQEALGAGGLYRTQAVLWPEDLPTPAGHLPLVRVPPLVHPLFQSGQPGPAIEAWDGVDLPETYILYHGPLDPISIMRLLSAWSWAASSIATYYPLLIYGCGEDKQHSILESARQFNLADSLHLLPPASPVQLSALYHGCSLLFHPGPVSPWGDPLRHALSCGKPVVAANSHWSDALTGSAGFLVSPDDLRGLGAALLTVIVEDDLAERLSTEARLRSKGWSADGFWQALINYGLSYVNRRK